MVRDERQGWAIYAAMSVIFLGGLLVCYWAEAAGNTNFAALGLDPANMEGKEVRFGIANSSLWAVATTAASNGSVNSMHDSFTPLGGMMPMAMIQLGEIIYGGVGSGLYGVLLYVILAVFIAGLMVGRTPEYLGKKIEAKEVKMAILAILVLPLFMLGFTAAAAVIPSAVASTNNAGPHGFSRNPVRVYVANRKQRIRIRGPDRKHHVVQRDRRPLDAVRTLLRHHPGHGDRGLAGCEEDRTRLGGHFSDHRQPVRRSGSRRDPDHRRPEFLPRARAWTDRRTARDERETVF